MSQVTDQMPDGAPESGPDSGPDGAPVVSIMVISYNTRQMTLDCLRSVIAETTLPYELIVIDNASEDGSAEAIAEEFPDITLMAEADNHGFAMANNLAAKRARGEYLLLLNPDTVVLEGAIDRVVAFARETPEAKIWGGRTLWGDRTLNPTSCWRRLTLWNIFCRTSGLASLFPKNAVLNSEGYGGWDRGNRAHVDVVTGCFMLMRRADWAALEGFDPRFVMYGEEVDLCLRAARDIGARPMITPEATLVHYGGASQKVRADKLVRLCKAKAELIKTHFPPARRALAMGLFRLWPLSRRMAGQAMAALGRREPGQGAGVWGEVWDRRAEWQDGFS